MTAQERNKRLKALGYKLVRGYFCPIRRKKMPYATVPDNRAGGTNVFDNLQGVEKYIKDVEQVRAWQAEVMANLPEEIHEQAG